MKILYAIQGTGNGHISRARDIIPLLQKKGELDILISGTEADVELGCPVRYQLKGLSFVFGKKGGVDLVSTYKKAKLKRFYREVKRLPVKEYDLVINDFEPVSAWACRYANRPCISLSHQAAVINRKSPRPASGDVIGKSILKKYAPATDVYGFHFKAYDQNIFTPVIRNEIRAAENKKWPHYTVYLPAYSDKKIMKALNEIPDVEWQVFSKHSKKTYSKGNVHFVPVNNKAFIQSIVTSTGVLCGAGFETPAEVLFLRKKLMVVPMKGQYEQQCNAAALKQMGVPVLKKLKKSKIEKISRWIHDDKIIPVDYPDITAQIIDEIFDKHAPSVASTLINFNSNNNMQQISLGKFLHQVKG
ncbi:MAG TPA: glycosyltransferase family protein [Candidatus Babeliaceae bacterium]|nr:glycosyltransferase family protein [Candidatus Babeliaceae bacterium]HVZ96516.1 glycosyltransferase family protein [Chitinophagaceae bacterium]